MSITQPHVSEWSGVCPKGCGGIGDAHKLTCPTLLLPKDWALSSNEEAAS